MICLLLLPLSQSTAGAESLLRVEPTNQNQTTRDRELLKRASLALQRGDPAQAYDMLSAQESLWAGDAGYDYLLGVAALDSGHAGDAVLALERLVYSLPGFVGARMELARAHYEAGDGDVARIQFTSLLSEQPPDAVRAVIKGYLGALSARSATQPPRDEGFYFTVGGGYDSNANGASDITRFLGFDLDPRNSETDSSYLEALIGGSGSVAPARGRQLSWRTELSHRYNADAGYADQTLAVASGAWSVSRAQNLFSVGAGAYWSGLDGTYNEHSVALDLGWARRLTDTQGLQLFLRAGPVRFDDNQSVRDVDRVLYALSYLRPAGRGQLAWSLFGGRDLADQRRNSPYSNTRIGTRLTAEWKLSAQTGFTVDLGYSGVDYNGNLDFFGTARADDQYTAIFALQLDDRPFPGWTLSPRVRFVSNDSNVALFDYDRYEIGFQLKRRPQ